MLKSILAVIVAYVAMLVLVFITLSGAWFVMGADGALEPGSYRVTGTWIAASLVLALIVAIIGGYVCKMIAGNGRAPLVLAIVVLIIGLALCIGVLMGEERTPRPRAGDVEMFDAMQNAEQPGWVALLNPIIGAGGVLIGARLGKRREK